MNANELLDGRIYFLQIYIYSCIFKEWFPCSMSHFLFITSPDFLCLSAISNIDILKLFH